jgi:prevent-host-death family protein
MRQVNVHEAKTQLSKLLQLVEQGEEVVIARNGEPVARLGPYVARPKRTGRGMFKGQIDMSRFDELDEEIARDFGMLD